ncbi:hypothetical protein EZS27_015310 [termite gut metagenome]|uniref:Uncharacterized protein n=1 Tax=termite gut metagenome TaxID=433724 RepID=A0A5J4RRC7_9ZZZZ
MPFNYCLNKTCSLVTDEGADFTSKLIHLNFYKNAK